MYSVYQLVWTEYERGWGQRPDGTSYHASKEKAKQVFDKAFENRGGEVPDCYSNPSSPTLIEVSKELYDTVNKEGFVWKHNL